MECVTDQLAMSAAVAMGWRLELAPMNTNAGVVKTVVNFELENAC